MRTPIAHLIGKTLRAILSLRGGGSALPGLVAEKISPTFLQDTLGQLRYGVVVISGTNGKTTTTKLVTEILQGQGLKVVTNKSGSNFIRGVISSIIVQKPLIDNLDADIAVFELDEAHAKHFVQKASPQYCLLLNVLRDQLDRFGEIDHTAKLLQHIATATTGVVVVNGDDPYLSAPSFLKATDAETHSYGATADIVAKFPNDRQMHSQEAPDQNALTEHTLLHSVDDDVLSISCKDRDYSTSLQLKGVYNFHNATGAVALVRAILRDTVDDDRLLESLANVRPAFGRGETILVDTSPIELYLVKNPSGFQHSLATATHDGSSVMIAINDDYADSRDMSWLWDVSFAGLLPSHIHTTTGRRAHDMALRLQYDNITVGTVQPTIAEALDGFVRQTSSGPKRIYCTYTAMLKIRKCLSRMATLEEIS